MVHRMISDELYERYVDVSVEVFMECYVSSLMDTIKEQTEFSSDEEFEFPAQLDARCRALIAKEHARRKRTQYAKGIAKCLRAVAVFALVVLSLSSVLFMTVEAIRVPIINYYIEQTEGYWEITRNSTVSSEEHRDTIDISDPLASLIPHEYYLNTLIGDTLYELMAEYRTASGNSLFFSSEPSTNMLQVDEEDAHVSQKCQIMGCDAILIAEDSSIRLVWVHEELSTTFTLISTGMTESEIVAIAEYLIYQLSN